MVTFWSKAYLKIMDWNLHLLSEIVNQEEVLNKIRFSKFLEQVDAIVSSSPVILHILTRQPSCF